MMASIKYILFDYYLSLERSLIIFKIVPSAHPSHFMRSLEYLAAYLRFIMDESSTKER